MRGNGILMHISSLPSDYGIGTMGEEAYRFIDFLADAGQKYWQVLPLCPTSYGDSPYQSFSTFAGNPYFIDLDVLCEQGLLKKVEYEQVDWESDEEHVNYGALYEKRYPILRIAANRFLEHPSKEFEAFLQAESSFWLKDYALFMALKDAHGGQSWTEWEEALRRRDEDALKTAKETYRDDIAFYEVLQYLFVEQWTKLKAYAHEKGIQLIGDLPIYVSLDSVDVWSSPIQFQLDENLCPKEVAGCPPDAFSADGQLWGNPLFDWEYMDQEGYSWWIKRIHHMTDLFDIIRIDHFRGFAGYYAIPFGDQTAKNGKWKTGPGMKLFDAIENALGRQQIIAEDLGFLTEDVRQLLHDSKYPGMRVLEFAFDSRDTGDSASYLPHNYIRGCACYTGTHDNEPVLGWIETAGREDVEMAREYLHLTKDEGENWGMMRVLWESVADLTVVQAQDILDLGHEARMNTPSTTGGNWCWRAKKGAFTKALAEKLHHKMWLYGRL